MYFSYIFLFRLYLLFKFCQSLNEIEKYVSKWNLREEDYGNLILTDSIEIVIIELSKFEKYCDNTVLADWVKFIINPKVINMENEDVKKAKEVLDEISQNEEERHLAELREKYIMDQRATEAAGYDKGLECGLKQGIYENKIQIAKKMKSQGFDIETIHNITELSVEEIKNL